MLPQSNCTAFTGKKSKDVSYALRELSVDGYELHT